MTVLAILNKQFHMVFAQIFTAVSKAAVTLFTKAKRVGFATVTECRFATAFNLTHLSELITSLHTIITAAAIFTVNVDCSSVWISLFRNPSSQQGICKHCICIE